MDRVLLINMPFYDPRFPSIALSLLKAELEREEIPCDLRYLNLAFAERMASEAYVRLEPYIPLLGDWVFSHDLFGDRQGDDTCTVEELLHQHRPRWLKLRHSISELAREVSHVRDQVEPFLSDSFRSIDWERYAIIGFSTMFQQNVASLAMAKRIKTLYPEKLIVFGGANCEEEMGEALHRLFPFVDVVCSGEADWVFPHLVKRLLHNESTGDIPNIVYRRGDLSCSTVGQPAPKVTLDELPYPDYEDYFQQLNGSPLAAWIRPVVLFETSRGCWWGERHHCTFCGFNANSMKYRSKSPGRALQELIDLSERYGIRQLVGVDSILDMQYFRDLIPELKRRQLKLGLYYETKSNLTREQISLLKEAGILEIQPGIESLSTPILDLMRKGCTALQNIQLLKWAQEAGIQVYWNLLLGFPQENPGEYQRMAEIIPAIHHLQPPNGCSWIRLDRFSPYFAHPEAHGLCRVRPLEVYRYTYPFDEASLSQLAYFFDFDYADGRNPLTYGQQLVDAVEEWTQRDDASLTYACQGERMLIRDERPGSPHPYILLSGAQKEIYQFCDQVHAVSAIETHVRDSAAKRPQERLVRYLLEEGQGGDPSDHLHGDFLELEQMRGEGFDRRELGGFLQELIDLRLMLRDEDRYLSLAVLHPGLPAVSELGASQLVQQP